VDNTNNDVVPGTAPQTALAGFEGGAMTDELKVALERIKQLEGQVIEARCLAMEAYHWVYKTTGLCTTGTRFGEFCYRMGGVPWFREYAVRFRLSEWGLDPLPGPVDA
jgi:hypothetical protein